MSELVNPATAGPSPPMTFEGQQYLRAYVHVAVQTGTPEDGSAQFTLNVPLSIASIEVTGPDGRPRPLPPPSAGPPNDYFGFSDADPYSGITLDVQVYYDYETRAAAGMCSVIFLLPPIPDQPIAPPPRWWAVTANNGGSGKTTFGLSADSHTTFGPLIGDPRVGGGLPPAFNATGTLRLAGHVVHGFLSADQSLPAGAPPFPSIFGVWSHLSPHGEPPAFTMSPAAPAGAMVFSPAGVLAPAVTTETAYTFELAGSYGTPGAPVVTSVIAVSATIIPVVTLAMSRALMMEFLPMDSLNVYWLDSDGVAADTVMKVAKAGGAPTVLVSGRPAVRAMARTRTNLYWIEDGGLMMIPLAGGSFTKLVSDPEIFDIAANATSLFWATRSSVMTVPIGGGTPTVLASVQDAEHLHANESSVYWLIQRDFVSEGAIMTVPVQGGTPVSVVKFLAGTSPMALAVDATNVYWTHNAGHTGASSVMKLRLEGGSPVVLAWDTRPISIAIDDASVYWGSGDGAVKKIPIEGGTAITVSSGSHAPWAVAVDETSVYWATSGTKAADYTDHAIMKASKLGDLLLAEHVGLKPEGS